MLTSKDSTLKREILKKTDEFLSALWSNLVQVANVFKLILSLNNWYYVPFIDAKQLSVDKTPMKDDSTIPKGKWRYLN